MKPAVVLTAGVLYGWIARWLFVRLADRAALRRSMDRVLAHAMELGLFLDEPAVVFRAQRDLIRANIRLGRVVVLPLVLSSVAFGVTWLALDDWAGKANLGYGEVAVASVRSVGEASLRAPFGGVVETPPLRVPEEGRTYWRVRGLAPVTEPFTVRAGGSPVMLELPPARYWGLHWWTVFGLASVAGALAGSRTRS